VQLLQQSLQHRSRSLSYRDEKQSTHRSEVDLAIFRNIKGRYVTVAALREERMKGQLHATCRKTLEEDALRDLGKRGAGGIPYSWPEVLNVGHGDLSFCGQDELLPAAFLDRKP
jgi:hypothetical protein